MQTNEMHFHCPMRHHRVLTLFHFANNQIINSPLLSKFFHVNNSKIYDFLSRGGLKMNVRERASVCSKIDRKWVKEEKRIFTEYPGTPGIDFHGGQETWMELAQFYVEDLRWLLSLDHHKFWSHMIYSDKAHELLVTFLKEFPPKYLQKNLLIEEDVRAIFKEMEYLVFLLFLRLSTEKESETCYMKNLGEIIYSNYLFTVPIILDICLIYGTSNSALVKKLISDVVTLAPYFLDDFQEIIPYFIHVLKAVKEKFSVQRLAKLEEAHVRANQAQDVIYYLYDSVATIQRFLELYPTVCRFFSKGDLITELVSFYSNVLPDIEKHCSTARDSSLTCDFIKNIRIDMLKTVKSVFDFISSETTEILNKTEMVDEYLMLMTELLAEPVFFTDYNLIYSVEFELECAVRNCENVDTVKLNHVLSAVASLISKDGNASNENSSPHPRLDSLIVEVKTIFPHLTESFIARCLKHYDHSAERVITAVLEDSVPSGFAMDARTPENPGREELTEFRGKHKSKHSSLSEMLDDREEINAIKEKCAQLCLMADETYDDEYDDTYDESIDVTVKEEEVGRRPFVVPRVLRRAGEEEEEGEGEEEEEEGEEDEEVDGSEERARRGCRDFVENPALVRERMEVLRAGRGRRDVVGRGRGQGQSREVTRNRGLKESHKSFIGNHNRKKQASRKMSRGMVPS